MNSRRTLNRIFLSVALLGVLGMSGSATFTSPPRGSEVPPIHISDLDGKQFDPAQLGDRPSVWIFGELYHQGTRKACAEIERVLNDPRLAGETITPILIVAQNASRLELKTQAESLGLAALVLHDVDRRTFGDFRVSVMPTIVIVGADRRVVYSVAGMLPRLGDLVTDSLLHSLGRLSAEQFEASLHPSTESDLSEEQIRAGRLTLLAGQLSRRGLDDLAEEKYGEALRLWPGSIDARLGMGRLQLNRGKLAEAESQFRAVLKDHPQHIDALLGTAYVATVRGGEELSEAERLVHRVLDNDDRQPRAHYLMGLIHEQRDELSKAASSFKRSAELLLQRQSVEP